MKKSRFIYSWLLFVCFLNVKYAEPAEAQVSAEDEFEDYLSSIEADFITSKTVLTGILQIIWNKPGKEFTVYEGTEPPVYAGGLFFTGTIETTLVHPHDSFSVVFAFPLYGRGRAVFVWSVGKKYSGWMAQVRDSGFYFFLQGLYRVLPAVQSE